MAITDLPFALLRIQYRIARTPLQLLEHSLIARMNTEAPARLLFQRAFGSLDATAGNLLRDGNLEESGIARIAQAAALGEAMRLDEEAEQKQQQASDELQQKREQAASAPQQARQEATERVKNARETADQRKAEAAQNAAQRTAQAKQRIDESANQKVQAAEKAKQSAQNRSKAAQNAEEAVAEAQLDDAADKRKAATGARAHAERLDDFSDAEKQKRQAARNSDS